MRNDQVLFAGDSGNDLQVLASSVPSVLVGNATADVAREAVALATEAGHREALHVARGGLFGMNGNYAAGILEGVGGGPCRQLAGPVHAPCDAATEAPVRIDRRVPQLARGVAIAVVEGTIHNHATTHGQR